MISLHGNTDNKTYMFFIFLYDPDFIILFRISFVILPVLNDHLSCVTMYATSFIVLNVTLAHIMCMLWGTVIKMLLLEMLGNTKGVIRSRKLQDRQYNDQNREWLLFNANGRIYSYISSREQVTFDELMVPDLY